METIGITGGTGLVGSYLSRLLVSRGYEVILLTRSSSQKSPAPLGCTFALWDPARKKVDTVALARLDAVVHLAGESVSKKRWTKNQKEKIVNSRIEGTRFLLGQLGDHASRCKTFVGASATGFYGPDTGRDMPFTEGEQHYPDFLGVTTRNWEAEEQMAASTMRTVILRTGIVLAKEGGAFYELTKLLPYRLLPVPANGRQIVSWIHANDLAALYVSAIENKEMTGIYNAVAPAPVSYNELAKCIKALTTGLLLAPHVPPAILKIVLGEMSIEVLKSCTVSSQKTLASGFRFKYPDVVSAVTDLLGR